MTVPFKEIRMTPVIGLRPKLFLLLILLVFASVRVFPQDKVIERNVSNMEKEARELFQKKDFISALPLYSQLLSLEPKNPDLNYRFGVCLLMGDRRDLERPLRFLEIAIKDADIEKEAFFYLGLAYHYNYRFSDAITFFNRYIGLADPSKVKELQVTRQIEMCENGFMLLSDVSDIYVLSRSQVNMTDFYRAYQLKNFGGEFLLKPDIFKSKIDKKNKDNDVMFFPQVLDEVFFASYGDDLKNGRDIFHAYREPDGSWGKPIRLVGEVNSSFDEAFPYLLPDGKTLYFCSKGHNSMGGYDVFLSRLDTMTGRWGKPENLDFAVNTPFDDLLFVTDKSKRIAYFASNRSSSGKQVNVYKVRIDKRPEKSRDIALQPLSAQGDGNRTRYEQSLAIIREMSRLDVNTGSEALADTSGPAPEIPVILAKTRQEPESVPLALSREQKMAKAVADKKEVQAKVDSAYQRVEQMSQSLKAFEKVTENAGQLANKLSDPRQKSIAQTVVKELDKTAKGKNQRLENARYRAGLMQQLVATQKTDSALKVYSYFKKDITEIDTLTEYAGKLREDARIAIAGRKSDSQNKDVVFQTEELKKVRKDSAFILSFVQNSVSAETGLAPGLVVSIPAVQPAADTNLPVAIAPALASEENKPEKSKLSVADTEKTMAAVPVKGKDFAAERLDEKKDSLVSYLEEIQSQQDLVEAYVAENLEKAGEKIIAFNELAEKKISKNESLESRELKLQSIRNEAVTSIARVKVAAEYAKLLDQTFLKAKDEVQQLDSLEKALSYALTPADVQRISHAMEAVQPLPAALSAQSFSDILKQEIEAQDPLRNQEMPASQYNVSEGIVLDSLSRELTSKSEIAETPARRKELEATASNLQQKSREAGRKVMAENDRAGAQTLLLREMTAIADTFSLAAYVPAESGSPVKEKTAAKKSKGVDGKPVVQEDMSAIQTAIVELSPSVAVSNTIGKPEEEQQYLLEKQKAILPADPLVLAQSKEEAILKIGRQYPEEAAMLTKPKEVESAQTELSDQQLLESSEALSENISSGVDQVDRVMDNDIPAGSIPVLMSQLAEYEALADKGLAEIRKDKARVQREKGSFSEIARQLEMKEFEVMASKNRAKYLSYKLKSQELSSQGGEIALLSSASLLETDSDILFAKASLLRDSLARTDGFLVKKQLYTESFALEDTALSRQEKAIVIRTQAMKEQELAEPEQAVKTDNSDIARYVELKEFEVMASKNRAKYLANKQKSRELSSQGGEIALLNSASLLETESDILVAKASMLRDSLARSGEFPVKKQLYAESLALEDTAISKQIKAIAIREQALKEQTMKEQALKEQALKEQALKEQALKEQDLAKIDPKPAKSAEPVQNITPAAKLEKQTAILAEKPATEAPPAKQTKPQVSERQLMESSKTLADNIALGVAQIEEIMARDVPAGSIPLIQGKLTAYEAMADQGLEEIQKQKIQVKQEKGSDSDIAMFLELKEFEIISTRNRARYLANVLKAKEMGQETALARTGDAGRSETGYKAGDPLPAATQDVIRSLPLAARTVAERVALAVREQKLPELQGLYYTVQVGVFATPRSSERLMGVTPLFEDRLRNGYYRYFSGIYNTKASATEAKNSIVARGIKDAFVVAIYNGEKLNAAQAKAYEPQTIDSQISTPALEAVVNSVSKPPGNPVFRVQLGAFRIAPTQQLLTDFALKTGEKIVTDMSAAGLSLVMTNSLSTFDQAQAVKQKAVVAGIKDAFIVGYIGNERTTAARVKAMLNIK